MPIGLPVRFSRSRSSSGRGSRRFIMVSKPPSALRRRFKAAIGASPRERAAISSARLPS